MSSTKCYAPDWVGYGKTPPQVIWPGNKRLAISFVLNYEEGGEKNILNGDKESEEALYEIIGSSPIKNRRNLVAESCYEYGSRVGVWRILRLFSKYNIKCTVFAVGKALELNPNVAKEMKKEGHEIASHGYRWFNYRNLSYKDEKRHVMKVNEIHEKLINEKPKGIYVGSVTENSRKIVSEFDNFEYLSDAYNDDLPYYDHQTNHNKPLLVIPYTLVNNDFRFLLPSGFVNSQQFFAFLKDSFHVLLNEGGKLMNIGLHCRIAGHPGRIGALDSFLQYIQAYQDQVWIATRIEIATFWKKNFPPQSSPSSSSQLSKNNLSKL